MDRLDDIFQASQEDALEVADAFTISSLTTPQRTLNATTGTLADVRLVLSTLLTDMNRRGMNRGTG